MHSNRLEPPCWRPDRYDWRRHGPMWGFLAGGLATPIGLYLLCGPILGDTGGPLIWPLMAMFFGPLGVFFGRIARSERREVRPVSNAACGRTTPETLSAPVRWVGGALAVLGLMMLFDSSRMPRLRNEAAYQTLYLEIAKRPRTSSGWKDETKEFHQLREDFLTLKTFSENYGSTLLICGISLPAIWAWKAKRRTLLRTRVKLILFGTAVSLVTVLGQAAYAFLAVARGELPWWGDSIAIRLLELPVEFGLMVAWVAGHSILVGGKVYRSRGLDFHLIRAWLILLLGAAAGLALWAIAAGDFLLVGPRMLWFAFYYAVLRGHVRTVRLIVF